MVCSMNGTLRSLIRQAAPMSIVAAIVPPRRIAASGRCVCLRMGASVSLQQAGSAESAGGERLEDGGVGGRLRRGGGDDQERGAVQAHQRELGVTAGKVHLSALASRHGQPRILVTAGERRALVERKAFALQLTGN